MIKSFKIWVSITYEEVREKTGAKTWAGLIAKTMEEKGMVTTSKPSVATFLLGARLISRKGLARRNRLTSIRRNSFWPI